MKKRRHKINPDTLAFIKQIGVGVLVLSLVTLTIYGTWYATRLPAMTINEVLVSGGETIDHEYVKSLAESSLEGTYLGLIPREFTWFYPQTTILEKVSQMERVHNVKVDRSAKKIFISFDEYLPDSLWCSPDDCYFVDENGFSFGKAPNLSGGSFLRVYTPGHKAEVGVEVLDLPQYQKIKHLVQLLADNNWFISSIEIDQMGDGYLKIVDGGELKVNLSEEPEAIVENLLVIIASNDFNHLEPGNFQYIDLRFGNKVFVNEEIATSSVELASDVASSTQFGDN